MFLRKRRRKVASWRKKAVLGLKNGLKRPIKRSKLRKQLDELAALVVKNRDAFTCQRCQKKVSGGNCHCSHVIPRSAGDALRWDTENMKVLCYFCHLRWWHKNPIAAYDWFTTTFPDRWLYLQANRGVVKFSDDDLLVIKKKLEADLEAFT